MKTSTYYIAPFLLAFLMWSCQTTETTQHDDADESGDGEIEIPHYEDLEYPELRDVESPEVTTFELDNGITFYLLEDDELPLIDVNVRVRSGSFMVPDEKTGLHTIMASLMREGGSENYPADELDMFLESRGAQIETGMGTTSASANMNVLDEDFEEVLPVFLDVLQNPEFPVNRLAQIMQQQESSIARRNDSQAQVTQREFRRLIYGKQSVQGRMTEYETLDNIDLDDLFDLHDRVFVSENLKVGVTGNFDEDEMRAKLEEAFSDFRSGEPVEIDIPDTDYEYESTINLIDKPDVNQSDILMGHLGGRRDNPDYAALQMMNQILSGGFSGRLFRNVRSDQGLAYAVYGTYGSNSFYNGVFNAGVRTASETTAEAIDAVKHEIVRMQEEEVAQEELEETRERIMNRLVFRYETKASALSEIMNNDYRGLPRDAFDQYIEELQEVTPEDVKRVANEYINTDQMHILVVGNADEIGDQLERYGEVNEIDISIPGQQQQQQFGF